MVSYCDLMSCILGPCGPCTEIHFNPNGDPSLDSVTELWNLVFVQFDREMSGTLRGGTENLYTSRARTS